ncbi:MAG: hypothetical protein JW864_15385 [Spirochaetes bacterium]|nr:hypothetical protein [Spirochaetota bacterium]
MNVNNEVAKQSRNKVYFSSSIEFRFNSLSAESLDDAYENYVNLKKLYLKWNTGLFKSTRYYKKYIANYLISIIGKEILTDSNYYLISPENIENKQLICSLYKDRWLQIKGNIKQDDLIGIVKKDPTLLTKWWRSGKMLSIRGVVRDFKLGTDKYGALIILYLKDVKIKEAVQK